MHLHCTTPTPTPPTTTTPAPYTDTYRPLLIRGRTYHSSQRTSVRSKLLLTDTDTLPYSFDILSLLPYIIVLLSALALPICCLVRSKTAPFWQYWCAVLILLRPHFAHLGGNSNTVTRTWQFQHRHLRHTNTLQAPSYLDYSVQSSGKRHFFI